MAVELLCQPSDVLDAWPGYAALTATRQASLISRASQKILNFCRVYGFLQYLVSETFNGTNSGSLWLTRRPVISVLSVTINGDALDNTYDDAWVFDPKTGRLTRGDGQDDPRFPPWFPSGLQNIVVQYWAGFTAVPDPVVEATVQMVKYLSDQAPISGIFAKETIGDYEYDLNTSTSTITLPRHIADLLAEYVQDDVFA